MEPKPPTSPNPLGLNIDFMFGRGYLWARQERLSDWMVLESLRMEIPDLQFPFDARGGLNRFRNTRCLVREIEVSVSEAGLQELLHQAASDLEGFEDLKVRFLEDAIHVSLKISAFGVQTPMSFRVALIPPEPPKADEVHLSLYDYRAYGPLPYPARQIAFDLLTSLLGTATLRPPGRGRSFTVGIAGDILSFRPLKLILLHIFPRVGWKLPNLSGITLEGAKIRPGHVALRASGREDGWQTVQQDQFHLAASQEGAKALAAYEAKDLFSHVDQAIFENQTARALELLESFREVYGAHPELVNRTFDCLLSNPTASNLAEAAELLRELEREDSEHLGALLAAPILATLSRQRPTKIIEALERLSQALKRRQDLDDWILCEQAIAQHLKHIDAGAAVRRLREVLKLAPRNLQTLELLEELYRQQGDFDGYEEILKRLAGLYTDRQTLKQTYMTLAEHLIERRGQVNEARLYLERVLRLEPADQEALYTLGQSYLLSDEPLRAIKTFGSAARAALAQEDWGLAAKLQLQIAQRWAKELENPSEGLLSARRGLQYLAQLKPGVLAQDEVLAELELDLLELAADLSTLRERDDEALDCWTQLLPKLEERYERELEQRRGGAGRVDPWESGALLGLKQLERESLAQEEEARSAQHKWQRRLQRAHEQMARSYQRRDRPEAAVGHWRRGLELDPGALVASEQLERYYRELGRPEELIAFYRDRLMATQDEARRVSVEIKLAAVYEQLQMVEEAQQHLQEALRLKPSHELARAKLAELLSAHGRYETLRLALQTLLIRVQDRGLRYELLMQLGQLQLGRLKQPKQAARAFFEALDLRHADQEALMGARSALDEIILRDGVISPAPVGTESAGRLQERVLLKLADLQEAPLDRAALLDEVAALATHRGDVAQAQESSRRARQLRQAQAQPASGQALDERLDQLLTPSSPPRPQDDEDDEDDSAPEAAAPQADEIPQVIPAHERRRFDARYIRPSGISTVSEAVEVLEESPEAVLDAHLATIFERPVAQDPAVITQEAPSPSVDQFRDKLQGVLTGQAKLAPKATSGGGGLAKLIARSKARVEQDAIEAPSAHDAITKPKVQLRKPELEDDLLDGEDGEESTSAVDAGLGLGLEPEALPPSFLDEETHLVDEGTLEQVHADSALLSEALDDAWDAMALMAKVDAARHAQDPEELARALEEVLSATPIPEEHPHLERAQYLALARELGEVLYYELELSAQAQVYLERVRESDPEGLGKEPSLLNALESIYEESGALEDRLNLLRERMAQCQTRDMATTYRLLIAQILWDERRDYEAATEQLRVILKDDARHEPAHRLWAQIAREREDWATAASHYEEVLQERVGGLDEVELERELADLYLHKLRQPLRARQHYEGVLQASPADAQALEGIKQSQALLGDWAGYIGSLWRELALLIGGSQPSDPRAVEPAQFIERVPVALRTFASQIISDAAQVAQDELRDEAQALTLWSLAFALWPEHFEALERKVALARSLDQPQTLSDALEAWAELLFDPGERFDALYEVAKLKLDRLDDEDGARMVLAEAIASVEGLEPPKAQLDEAKRLLRRLSD